MEWKRDDPQHEKKPTKIPYQINGNFADVLKPETWAPFIVVVEAKFGCNEPVDHATPITRTGFSGIGFVLTHYDPYCFCDLDDTSGDPALLARQIEIFQSLNSYSEQSPSGKGLHVIVKASVPKGRRRSCIELYSSERYMTMTGNVFKDLPIGDRQREVTQLFEQLGGGIDPAAYEGNSPQTQEDERILEIARGAVNGAKFEALYSGNWRDHYGPEFGHDGEGHSEADFALIDIIAFYTQNKDQIKRIFRASQLGKRDKAKRDKYLEAMINRSFDRMIPLVSIENMQQQLEFQIEAAERKKAGTTPGQVQGGNAELPVKEAAQPWLPTMAPVVKYSHLEIPPPGLMGEIAKFVFASSPTPVREIALAAAIGVMAGIAGRCYNVSGAGLNQYILCLAATGSGKEQVSTGISHLMNSIKITVPAAADFRGPAQIRSDAGLIKWLGAHPSVFSIIGEFGIRLKQLSSQNANSHEMGIRALLLDLYNKSGAGKQLDSMAYSDKEKNTKVIHNVAFTLLAESTPETFYGALDESMISEGLLPRFTIIEYEGEQPPLNETHDQVKPDFILIDNFGKFSAGCLALNRDDRIIQVQVSDEAREFSKDLREFARMKTNNADRDLVRQLWSRVNMKTLKLAALVAVGVNPFAPVISLPELMWAKSLVVADVLNLLRRFEMGEVGKENEESKQERAVRRVCRDYLRSEFGHCQKYTQGDEALALHAGKLIPYVYISRRLSATAAFRLDPRGVTYSLQRTIKNLIDMDILREVPLSELKAFGTRQKCYMASNYEALIEG